MAAFDQANAAQRKGDGLVMIDTRTLVLVTSMAAMWALKK